MALLGGCAPPPQTIALHLGSGQNQPLFTVPLQPSLLRMLPALLRSADTTRQGKRFQLSRPLTLPSSSPTRSSGTPSNSVDRPLRRSAARSLQRGGGGAGQQMGALLCEAAAAFQ